MAATTLSEAIAQYGRDAYLLTIAPDGPHTSFVTVDLRGNSLACEVGRSAARNIADMPNVSVFWPARQPGDYAIVLNGLASLHQRPGGGMSADIAVSKSVFHRPGARLPDGEGPCTSDCRRITRPA